MKKYAIFFTGEAQENITIDQLKINLSKLFKTEQSKLEKIFIGKAVCVKKNVTIEVAKKYQQAMINAGAKVFVKAIAIEKVKQNSDQISSGLAGLINYNKNTEENSASSSTLSSDAVEKQVNQDEAIDNSIMSASTESLEEFTQQVDNYQMPDLSKFSLSSDKDSSFEAFDEPDVNFEMPDLDAYSLSEVNQGSFAQYTKKVVAKEIQDISYMDITDQTDRPLSDQDIIKSPVKIPNTGHLLLSQAEQGSLEEFTPESETFDASNLSKLELQDSSKI
jgi:hypothetical protein